MLPTPVAVLRRAADALGWEGSLVGPVDFRATRFWAVVHLDGHDDSDLSIVGCLVTDDDPDPQANASLLAAYAPRAVLVSGRTDLTQLAVDAALLDQGLVRWDGGTVEVVATPGPRSYAGSASARERQLLSSVSSARERRLSAPV